MAVGYRSKFFQTYASKVLPMLYKFEKERKRKYTTILVSEIVMLIILLYMLLSWIFPSAAPAIPSDSAAFPIFLFLTPVIFVLLIFAIILVPSLGNKKFKTKVKEACIGEMLSVFGDIQWHGKYLPVPLDIDSSGLFMDYSKCMFDDVFTGCHKGINYTVAEAHLTKIVRTRKGSHEQTVFRGIILDFPFNKEIKAHTIIAPKYDTSAAGVVNVGLNLTIIFIILALLITFAFIAPGTLFQNMDAVFSSIFIIISLIVAIIGAKKFKKVKLEDVIFDKDYTVASEDQVEARYLVTPSFMERFKNLKKAYNSKNIKCALFDNQIMFAIYTNKDLFEIGSMFHPLTDSKQVDGFFDEIIAILDIVEEFKLDEKTGL